MADTAARFTVTMMPGRMLSWQFVVSYNDGVVLASQKKMWGYRATWRYAHRIAQEARRGA